MWVGNNRRETRFFIEKNSRREAKEILAFFLRSWSIRSIHPINRGITLFASITIDGKTMDWRTRIRKQRFKRLARTRHSFNGT